MFRRRGGYKICHDAILFTVTDELDSFRNCVERIIKDATSVKRFPIGFALDDFIFLEHHNSIELG